MSNNLKKIAPHDLIIEVGNDGSLDNVRKCQRLLIDEYQKELPTHAGDLFYNNSGTFIEEVNKIAKELNAAIEEYDPRKKAVPAPTPLTESKIIPRHQNNVRFWDKIILVWLLAVTILVIVALVK